MNEQKTLDYARIAQAIGYIRENFKRQPGLDEIAGEVALSTAHFQRMFTEWAGISPKKFLQYTSIEYAKRILNETHASLFDAAQETGLSGTGRLYDLFVNIEGMTPGEYKNGGESLSINYSFAKSPFGEIFIASTDKGICCMEFADEHDAAFNSLWKKFPNAKFTSIVDEVQQNALFIFTQDWSKLKEIKLHLKGTDFQLKVWETLLKIPVGGLTTYGDIAAASSITNTFIGERNEISPQDTSKTSVDKKTFHLRFSIFARRHPFLYGTNKSYNLPRTGSLFPVYAGKEHRFHSDSLGIFNTSILRKKNFLGNSRSYSRKHTLKCAAQRHLSSNLIQSQFAF